MNGAGGQRRGRGRGRLALVALGGLFFLPIAIAFWLNVNPSDALRDGAASHGRLIEPPARLPTSRLRSVDGAKADEGLIDGRWSLMHLAGAGCGQTCRDALYLTRQTRIALGKEAYRVQRVLVFRQPPAPPEHTELNQVDPGLRVLIAGGPWWEDVGRRLRADAGHVLIVDPTGLLLMTFDPGDNPRGLLQDLKRLLKLSKIG